MLTSQIDIENQTAHLIKLFGDAYPWRWEADKKVNLSEFASNKKEKIFELLTQNFQHQWNVKSIRNLPDVIRHELGDFANIKGEQIVFTSSATHEQPTIVAIWWPWGHGGTISLRLSVIEETYHSEEIKLAEKGIIGFFKRILS